MNGRIFVTGDVHGDTYDLCRRMDATDMRHDLNENDALVILGDVGLSYGKVRSRHMLRTMADAPCSVVVMRGNHDARYCRDMRDPHATNLTIGDVVEGMPSCFADGPVMLAYESAPSVWFAPDEGGWWQTTAGLMLMIPGAWSIDGLYRRVHMLPFEAQEQLTKEELGRLLTPGRKPDVILSHTCPLSWFVHMRDLLLDGAKTDNEMERALDDWARTVDWNGISDWHYGHFHDDREIPQDTPGIRAHLHYHDVTRIA